MSLSVNVTWCLTYQVLASIPIYVLHMRLNFNFSKFAIRSKVLIFSQDILYPFECIFMYESLLGCDWIVIQWQFQIYSTNRQWAKYPRNVSVAHRLLYYALVYRPIYLLKVYIIFIIPLCVPRKCQKGAWDDLQYDTNQKKFFKFASIQQKRNNIKLEHKYTRILNSNSSHLMNTF
jgi:hypothetical protein